MALSPFLLQQQVEVGRDVYIFKLGCSCDGTALAAATSEHTICVLDPASLRPVQTLRGHADAVEDLSFFQGDGACLASCSQDGSARVWDLRAGGPAAAARRFAVSSREAYSCSVGRSDRALACAASEKVHLFDVAQGRRLCVYKESHTDVVNHVRFHPGDTTRLLSGAEDNLVVVLDTNHAREDEAMLGVIPNDECVRSFTLIGPDRNVLCCASTTEDVRIYSLGSDDFGARRAEFLGLRCSEVLAREESGGYLVETFYDQPSGQVLLLAGAGSVGELVLFSVAAAGPVPVAALSAPADGADPAALRGHDGIVRSAVCIPGSTIVTAGEDGRVCAWRVEPTGACGRTSAEGAHRLRLEPTAYRARRTSDSCPLDGRAAPY
mmetsp:Transcript_25030/g.74681  ORF Transcript_25030/g.74681 Transcript_25030/m.74681 type:complete len:380 (+) Transcript_25030:133-1272(+)